MSIRSERVTDSLAYHGEGPVWWTATRQLRFLDMLAGQVIALNLDGSHGRIDVGADVVACLRPRATGGAIIARTRDIAIADKEDLSDIRPITETFIEQRFRFNEGGCDPDGRFYIGNMAWQKAVGEAAFYCIEADEAAGQAQPRQLFGDVTTSNGIAFSPDGKLAYYNDTETMRTDVFDYDAQSGLHNRRPFVQFVDGEGRPDGLCVDVEGGVWVAMNKANAIRRYDSDGKLDEIIEFPVRQTTACTFGGPDLDTLYVTTSREGLDPQEEPAAGSLYAAHPGIKGLAPLPFGG